MRMSYHLKRSPSLRAPASAVRSLRAWTLASAILVFCVTVTQAQTIPVTPTPKASRPAPASSIAQSGTARSGRPTPPVRQPGPPLPHREDHDCEYCDRSILVCSAVKARVADRADTTVVFSAAPGDTLILMHSRTHVFTPGKLVLRDTLRPAQLPYGAPRVVRALLMVPGDTIYVLTVGTEGSDGTWWYKGQQYRSENTWMSEANQPYMLPGRSRLVTRSVSPIRSAWWMRVRNSSGQTGWIQHQTRALALGSHYDARPACK
jgi:hypothetical protein